MHFRINDDPLRTFGCERYEFRLRVVRAVVRKDQKLQGGGLSPGDGKGVICRRIAGLDRLCQGVEHLHVYLVPDMCLYPVCVPGSRDCYCCVSRCNPRNRTVIIYGYDVWIFRLV